MRLIKRTILFILLTMSIPAMLDVAIDKWWTNAESEISSQDWLPKSFSENAMQDEWLRFVLSWINKRKTFLNAINKYSDALWIDNNLVLACVMWEQIRIKVSTARKILNDAVAWWYWELLLEDTHLSDRELANRLIYNDDFNAKYATYLVRNILERRWYQWYSIQYSPWIVWTLYNMGNDESKIPHENPKVWWTIMYLNWEKYTYWEVVAWVFYYLDK